MKLTSLHVQNYKSFADSGVVELGPINIIVGRNNAGKSAFIHAAHLLQSGADYNQRNIRIGADQCDMTYQLTDISLSLSGQIGGMSHQENVELAVSIGKSR